MIIYDNKHFTFKCETSKQRDLWIEKIITTSNNDLCNDILDEKKDDYN